VQCGNVMECPVTFVNAVSGSKIVQSFAYDGTRANLESIVQQAIKDRQNTGTLSSVPAGTVLSLTPVTQPAPVLTADQQLAVDFAAAWRTYQLLKTADALKWGNASQQSAVTSQLATALSNAQTLYAQKPSVCIPLMGAI
jgi:hypothetical protein